MKVIDLTHTIRENMPVYPGTEPPKLIPASSYESDGFKETLLQMYTHTGTHMDPPAHIFSGRTTLDEFPVDQFIGKALVIDCRELKEGIGFDVIGLDPISDEKLIRHHRLFEEKGIVNIENLKNLNLCGTDLFWFSCFPLKVENCDGSPIRAVAWFEQ